MREVCHRRIKIVIDRLGLDVEVPGNAIHHQVPRYLAARVFWTRLPGIRSPSLVRRIIGILLLPIFVLLLHFQFALGVSGQRRDGAVHFVVGQNRFSAFVQRSVGKAMTFSSLQS